MNSIEFYQDMIKIVNDVSEKKLPKKRVYINYMTRLLNTLLVRRAPPLKIKHDIVLEIK
jgi:hypothetical protein